MRVCLLTTTDVLGTRRSDLHRLVSTVARERGRGMDAELWLLLQRCDAARCAVLRAELPEFVHLSAYPARLSLSAARNILLGHARAAAAHHDAVVAFPDDDCWYPPDFLRGLTALFAADPALDVFVCGFSSAPVSWDASAMPPERGTDARVIRTTSSNNMFFRGSMLRGVVRFDEALGLGAQFNGGEDTEFVLRAWLTARHALVLRQPLVGHPETSIRTLGKYYRGTTLAIAKHAWSHPAVMRELVRKLLVGAVLLARREVRPADFAPALSRLCRPGNPATKRTAAGLL